VLPSVERTEAFGIVGLEALAAGLPLITTELGTGTSYYNRDGSTGVIVTPGRPDEIAQAIRHILGKRAGWLPEGHFDGKKSLSVFP
jgi:Glycosyltransferase